MEPEPGVAFFLFCEVSGFSDSNTSPTAQEAPVFPQTQGAVQQPAHADLAFILWNDTHRLTGSDPRKDRQKRLCRPHLTRHGLVSEFQ